MPFITGNQVIQSLLYFLIIKDAFKLQKKNQQLTDKHIQTDYVFHMSEKN